MFVDCANCAKLRATRSAKPRPSDEGQLVVIVGYKGRELYGFTRVGYELDLLERLQLTSGDNLLVGRTRDMTRGAYEKYLKSKRGLWIEGYLYKKGKTKRRARTRKAA
jgi:hypothetical protein